MRPQPCPDVDIHKHIHPGNFELSPILTVVVEQHDVHCPQQVSHVRLVAVHVQRSDGGEDLGVLPELFVVVVSHGRKVPANDCGGVETIPESGGPEGRAVGGREDVPNVATCGPECEQIVGGKVGLVARCVCGDGGHDF